MSAELDAIAQQQGWSDRTLLDLCLEYIGNQQNDDAFTEFLEEKAASENDEVVTSGPFVFRASQENGDYVDCKSCGTTLNDDRHEIVTNTDGFAFCSPKCLLDDHDKGETLHAFEGADKGGWEACATCGDTEEGLMHTNTERNIEPLLWAGE